jgi:hypothetical protein
MKHLIFFLLIGLSTLSFGRRDVSGYKPYTFVSDSIASSVPVGFCLVKGFAYNYSVGVPNAMYQP